MQQRWDIFCDVVDNFGDIGVCWRLARQLAAEYQLEVQLWVNHAQAAHKLIPSLQLADAANGELTWAPQQVAGVTVCHWQPHITPTPVADVAIEAFACHLPATYVAAMNRQTVWLNLEYLSAEDWIADFHEGVSVHPHTGMRKTFFFPGFTPATGGLILEQGLLAERDAFQASPAMQAEFWRALGLAHLPTSVSMSAGLKLSLFSYPHAPLASLLDTLAHGEHAVHCLVPESSLLPALACYFGVAELRVGDSVSRGQLMLHVLPFLSQAQYDRLLWACDLNFVRGEDSWVRAIWAGQPFIWQPYRQDEGTHITKLLAFMDAYYRQLHPAAAQTWRNAHLAWAESASVTNNISDIFGEMMTALAELKPYSRQRSNDISLQGDLAAKLVQFAAAQCSDILD